MTERSFTSGTLSENIEATGDTLIQKQEGTLRIAFQNIHGASDLRGWTVPSEIEAMEELEIDIMGMAETNKPWSPQQKALYDAYMNKRFRASRTIYTAAQTDEYKSSYQPGGNLITANGEITARVDGQGSDEGGRFCWYSLQGKRDEGVLIIVAYRVCQEKHNNPGPTTAYQQQYVALRQRGIQNPNPRQQILTDLKTLIDEKRARGYRPILMIDANGDYVSGKDKGLQTFLKATGLCDPYLERFPTPTRTYQHGSSRIDYIFMDKALTHSIKRIGYLGTHDGATSDHVLAYVDMEQQTMFAGLIHRPPPAHSREILIEQEDKVQDFLCALRPQFEAQNIECRVFDLARQFAEHKATSATVRAYNNLYGQFLEIVRGVANKVGRKKYGYMRSPALARAGNHVLLMRYAWDCKRRDAPPTKRLLTLGGQLQVDIHAILDLSERELLQTMRKSRQALWECQKNCESLRADWLAGEAQARASASGDLDWETRLKKMYTQISSSAINRKLSLVTKGPRGTLRLIQTPTHAWFYSQNELYHYHDGVFEAYPAAATGLFHTHHTRKVLPHKIQAVEVMRDSSDKFWKISTFLPLPDPLWQDVTSGEEIEEELMRRNRMHLEQVAREEGISTQPLLTELRRDHGFNNFSSAILNGENLETAIESLSKVTGKPITEYTATSEMAAFFKSLRRTDTDCKLPPVLGVITSHDFQEMFKRARERTSSDPRTLNYTLWKCLAKSDKISGFASILLSLPFVYGFVNEHWTHMTDFMLEKKPGVRQIHTLRIIGKVSAEFNTCLKFFIGKQARDNFEKSETCEEQHGFRPHRSAPDAMMLKLLTFESARMQKCTIGSLQHDMTAHFDRMYPEMTSIYATKYAVSDGVMRSVSRTIGKLRRNVETSMGISEGSYGQEPGAPRLGGMVQGKADVPQLSTQQSDVMLRAHKATTYGVSIQSPGMHRSIQHHSIAFADDTEGQVSSDTTEDLSIARVVRRLQHSGQTWNNLANICGGLIAHHKCLWQLLTWETLNGHLQPVQNHAERLLLSDGKGASTNICYQPPGKPNVGLGFNLCPDGNQTPHFEATFAKIQSLCTSVAGTYLTERETWQLVRQRLTPKLSYALHGTSLTPTQCSRINKCIRPVIVPRLRLNRHFPTPLLYGPLEYGGLEFPDTATLQDQVQLDYLIKQLRWDKLVANDFLVALDSVQLCSGFTSPILENTKGKILYLSPSYIIELRHRLSQMDAYMWIEKRWSPELQRVGDESLMEAFLEIPGITRATLRRANAVRIYLRVVTIADITDIGGSFIPADTLGGTWQAGSDIKWPYQPLPPKGFWTTFRRCVRAAFCSRSPMHQRACHSMNLDVTLGPWLPVRRNTWYTAYMAPGCLLRRNDDGPLLSVMKRTEISGFYRFSHTTEILPVDSHPIRCQQTGDELWTQRPQNMLAQPARDPPPGHETQNTVVPGLVETVTIASDGSTHLSHGVASCAWIIHQSPAHEIRACFLICGMTSLSSYRSELEGTYRALLQLQRSGLKPGIAYQWCDNKAAVDKTNTELYAPRDMLLPDADILLAIKHTRTQLERGTKLISRHIYGHQDSRQPNITTHLKRHTTSNQDPPEQTLTASKPTLNLPARLNIECDKLATWTSDTVIKQGGAPPLGPTTTLPYTGSRALLNIGGTWITTESKPHILKARWKQPIRLYCCKKYKWTPAVFDTVDWKAVKSARTSLTQTQLMQTSKIIHGWLPVGHMRAHTTGSSQCPGCNCNDETFDHLLRCTNKTLRLKREEVLLTLRQKLLKLRFPRVIMEAVCRLLLDHMAGAVPTIPDHEGIAAAVTSQLQIGLHLLPRGIISAKWKDLLDEFSVEHPDRVIAGFLKTLWNDFVDQIWRCRNELAHHKDNLTQQINEESWASRLLWFLAHKHEIAHTDHFLLTFNAEDIQRMSGFSRRRLVTNLEKVRAAFITEKSQKQRGQHVITEYFTRKDGGRTHTLLFGHTQK